MCYELSPIYTRTHTRSSVQLCDVPCRHHPRLVLVSSHPLASLYTCLWRASCSLVVVNVGSLPLQLVTLHTHTRSSPPLFSPYNRWLLELVSCRVGQLWGPINTNLNIHQTRIIIVPKIKHSSLPLFRSAPHFLPNLGTFPRPFFLQSLILHLHGRVFLMDFAHFLPFLFLCNETHPVHSSPFIPSVTCTHTHTFSAPRSRNVCKQPLERVRAGKSSYQMVHRKSLRVIATP